MASLFKHCSSQDRLALIIRIMLYAQLLTVSYQCVLGIFEVHRRFEHGRYVAITRVLFSLRHAFRVWFDVSEFGFPIALILCLLFGLLVLRIPLKQAYFYTALCYLSLVLGTLQHIGDSLTWRE